MAHRDRSESKVCQVKLFAITNLITIPPKKRVVVMRDIRVDKTNQQIKSPEFPPLPPGLMLVQTWFNSCKAGRRLQVVIHNMTDHSVTLQPKHVIGEISAADTDMPFSSKQSPSFQLELRD